MDETLKAKVDEIIDLIENRPSHKRYMELLEVIKRDEQLYERLNEYRRDNFRLMAASPEEWIEIGNKQFNKYKDLFDNELTREFMYTEDEIYTIISKCKEYMYCNIRLDLDFFN